MFGRKKKEKSKKINKKNSKELGQLFKKQLDEAKEQFQQMEFQSQSEDGSVIVVATGLREIKSLSIAQELIGDKKDELEELVLSVVNDALRIVRAANMELTDEVTRSFNEQLGVKVN